MAIENHPIWSFEPNWTSTVSETFEWLTDIMQSPTGSEQRRCLRYYPNRVIDFSIAVEGPERATLENMLATFGSRRWYLPLWHDVTVLTAASDIDTNGFQYLDRSQHAVSEIGPGSVIFVAGDTPFNYQVAEVSSAGPARIYLTAPLTRQVPRGTRVFPMQVARLAEQPQFNLQTDTMITAEPQFNLMGEWTHLDGAPNGLTTSYSGFPVLLREPDWTERLTRNQERLTDTLEQRTSDPVVVDTANRPFIIQQQRWILDGPDDHAEFYALMQTLKGRLMPVWVPSWTSDFRLVQPAGGGSNTLVVERCGFGLSGGPLPEREYIMIERMDGARYYRRIDSTAVEPSGNETLTLGGAITPALTPQNVLRICFMSLMRLDHDSVEIEHITDLHGVSESSLKFRSAPDTRTGPAAFAG